MRADLPQLAAIVCITVLAAADLALLREGQVAVAAVSGLLGWMSHKATTPPPTP